MVKSPKEIGYLVRLMYNIGDSVQRIVPDTGYGCVGIIQSIVEQAVINETLGYMTVQITQGNSLYPVGTLTGWFINSVELI